MTVKLLTEQHLEFLSLKGGYTCQNATLLEITCHGSFNDFYPHSPASTESRRAVVSYKRKNVHQALVNQASPGGKRCG